MGELQWKGAGDYPPPTDGRLVVWQCPAAGKPPMVFAATDDCFWVDDDLWCELPGADAIAPRPMCNDWRSLDTLPKEGAVLIWLNNGSIVQRDVSPNDYSAFPPPSWKAWRPMLPGPDDPEQGP